MAGGIRGGSETSQREPAHLTGGLRAGGPDEGNSGPLGYIAGPGDPPVRPRRPQGPVTPHSGAGSRKQRFAKNEVVVS